MINVIQLKDGDCTCCDGCGYIADDDDGTPWRYWAELPMASAFAVQAGLVKPVACPACDGSGDI